MIKPLFQELSLPLWTELPGASEPPSDAVTPLYRSLLTAQLTVANTNSGSEFDPEDDAYQGE
jgi:hypothetical protein